MYLKSINVFGFKSFALDTRVALEPGITVIVGPNGGGKSNVIDAIRWALGEHRVKELRAEHWEDLLHASNNGQHARLAEVSLIFDNHDKEMATWPDSLTVTRRYYLSGDSEYLLNGRAVRLKDVVDLFLDSGVGRFNYAIIGQGRVEAALLMKPKDRLEQLEEAAGVSRYKLRRKETLQHLSDVDRNLTRLQDLISDVRTQQAAVEEEAFTEREYLKLQQENSELTERYYLAQYIQAQNDQREWKLGVQELARERELIRAEMAALETQKNQSQSEREAVSLRLESARTESRRLEHLYSEQKAYKARLEAELNGYAHELAGVQDQVRRIAGQMGRLDGEMKGKIPELAVVSDEPESDVERTKELSLAQQHLASLQREKDLRAEDVRRRQEVKEDLAKRLARFEGALHAQNAADAIHKLSALRQESLDLGNISREDAHQVDVFKGQVAAAQHQLGEIEKNIHTLLTERWELEARVKAMKSVEQERMSTPGPVKAVIQAGQKHELTGIVGAFGSLVKAHDSYERAVSVAIGSQAYNLVTVTESDARAIIEWLKERKAGRVTVFPLDQIRPSVVAERDRFLADLPGVEGWALDLVDFDTKLFPAVSHVLGRVLILTSLAESRQIGRQHQFRYKMVTLDGQAVLAGGAITGGSDRGPAGRADLSAPILSRIASITERLAQWERQKVQAAEGLARAQTVYQQATRQSEQHRHRMEQVAGLLSSFDGPDAPDVLDLARLFGEATQDLDRAESEWDNASAQWENARESAQKMREELQQIRQQHLTERQKAEHQGELFSRYQAEKMRMQQQHEELAARIMELQAVSGDTAALLEGTTKELSLHQQALAHHSEDLRQLKLASEEFEASLSALSARLAGLDREERKMGGRIAYFEQQLAKHEARWESYEAPDIPPLEGAEFEGAGVRLKQLQKSMDALGMVKPGIYALYTQLQERLSYLDRERQDVQLAKDELHSSLESIDQEVNGRLNETAVKVESAFSEACAALMGGEGGFRWITGEERGVDLWIRPPGKKPSTMTLLSGGEKALGGIAWLFALLKVRPSPFVVLDEVEAALDEANAEKVAAYIKAHHGTTQYVIVTHHKSTMVIGDGLWGVAGDGHGRSRLVSVRMNQTQDRAVGEE